MVPWSNSSTVMLTQAKKNSEDFKIVHVLWLSHPNLHKHLILRRDSSTPSDQAPFQLSPRLPKAFTPPTVFLPSLVFSSVTSHLSQAPPLFLSSSYFSQALYFRHPPYNLQLPIGVCCLNGRPNKLCPSQGRVPCNTSLYSHSSCPICSLYSANF